MKHFNIVIEGVDGTGKSTLAHRLRLELPSARIVNTSENKPRNKGEQSVVFAAHRKEGLSEGVKIFDRPGAISEAVYQDHGKVPLRRIQEELNGCQIDLLIWARRAENKCVMRVRKDDLRDVEYNKSLAPRIPLIIERYDALMPVLMDYMMHKGDKFELYNCDWEDPVEFDLFVHKIIMLIELSK